MIDFEKELKAILNDDPLNILTTIAKVSASESADNRLKASFEEINQFVTEQGYEPKKSRNIAERKLFGRLQGLRDNPEKALALSALDTHHLLEGIKQVEPIKIETVDDIFAADPLGLLAIDPQDDTESTLFDVSPLPSPSRASTDFVARRKPCKNFDDYKNQLALVQKEISENKRKLTDFIDKGEVLVEKNYYILSGILLYLEKNNITSEAKTIAGKRFRKDGRTRCIFENGTESNMKYRSLAKALYQGGKIVSQTEQEINTQFSEGFSILKEKDQSSGFIYVLQSLSCNPEIQQFEHLYKVGFSKNGVEKRIRQAKNEPTYLMADVHIMAEYETYNLNPQKLEKLLHQFFADVCLDIDVTDHHGRTHRPREWFIAPFEIIDNAIRLIINKQIQHYKYDTRLKEILVS